MPIKTKRKKVKLPFFTFQVPVGWEAVPLTAAQKKKRKADREKARREAAEAARKELQQHTKAQQAAKKPPPAGVPAGPRSTVGAAVMPQPGRAAPTKKTQASPGQLCGQPTRAGGACKRVVATKPCPEHPAGRPSGRP